MKRWTWMLAVVFLLLVVAQLSAQSNEKTVSGEQLYLQNCAACHGQNREGVPPAFPSLKDIGSRMDEAAIRQQIKNGKNAMPSFKHLSDAEIDASVAYLLGKKEVTVTEKPLTPVELGRRLFVGNCATCHQATIHDPEPAGLPVEHPMMKPAPLAGATKRFTKEQFFMILDHGPMYMPSFAHLSQEEKEALWAYAKSLEGKGEPSGPTMMQMRMNRGGGMEHPMGMGEHPRGREHPGMMGRGKRRGGMGRGMGMRRQKTIPRFTIDDVARAIQEHIQFGERLNNGYYVVLDKQTNTPLLLKLEKIHTERLARLANGQFFACVDMKEKGGTLYDIDFFLAPTDGKLAITDVFVHKVNGKPRYRWVEENGVWKRVPVK